MADYLMEVSSLESKKGTLSEMKGKVDQIKSNYESTSIKEAKEGYNNVASKISNNINRLTNGYNNSDSWLTGYLSDLNSLESGLASFSGDTLTKPIEFKGTFEDIFGKITMPAIKTGGDPNCNAELGPKEATGEIVLNGSIIETSKPVTIGEKYNLSDDDLAHLAYVAYREQGSVEGAKLELSLMCNLYEKNKSKYSSVRDYVDNSGWFASGSRSGYSYPGDSYFTAAKEVVNEGQRYLPTNVVEHDCLSDITYISTGSSNSRSDYIPGKTVVKNRYGATYVFVGFAPNGGDPFGYLV